MSDEPTRRIPPPETDEQPAGPRAATIAVVAAVLVALLIALVAVTMRRDPAPPVVAPTPTPVEEPTPTPEEEPTPTPTPTPAQDSTPTPTPTPEDEVREPTDADAAAFESRYQPPGGEQVESVSVDVTGDGRNEIVFASIVQTRTRIDIAVWDGRQYRAVYADHGGQADAIDDFLVQDFTDSGTREIVTVQTVGDERESLSIWGWDGDSFSRQPARGGCWDASHTYGIIGARISEGEIAATCDGRPLPRTAWPTDIYVWDGEAWVHERTELPG